MTAAPSTLSENMVPKTGRFSNGRIVDTNATAILALALAGLATAAVSLVTIDHVKDSVIDASLHGRPLHLNTLLGSLRPVDAALCAMAAVLLLVLPWLEWRSRAYSRLLATATHSEAFLVLTIIVGWCGHAYFGAGVLLGGDMATHISRFNEVQRGLQAGELPQWTNYQFAGAPLLWFTGPFTYVVGGLIAFAVHDAVLATKLLLFTLHLLAGWAYFAFLRRLGIRPVAAMLVSAGFASAFAMLHLFLFRGVVPQAFTIVFVVLLFYAADGLMRRQGQRWLNMLVFSLTTAAMIINHQPHALFAAFYLAVFACVACICGVWRVRNAPALVAAGLLGVITSAVAVVPVLFESDWAMIEPDGPIFQWQWPTVHRLLDLIVWRNVRTNWGVDYWAYMGLGVIVFGSAGIALLASGRLRGTMRGTALAACACLAFGLVLHNPVVRDIIFLMVFLGLLAAIGLDWLLDRPVLAGRGLLLAACVMIADLASTSIQPVARTDKGFFLDAGRRLEQIAPNERIVQLGVTPDDGVDADMGPDGSAISYYSTVQRIAGNHNMGATRLHNFLAATAKQVQADLLANGLLSPDTRARLGVFNVTRVICNTSIANGCPTWMHDTQDDPVLGQFIPVIASPVLFSQHLVSFGPQAGLEKPMLWPTDYLAAVFRPRIAAINQSMLDFLKAEDPDLATRSARAIAVRGDVPNIDQSAAAAPWHPSLTEYAVGLDTVSLQVQSDGAGYVQLAHPWFPSTIVTVNGTATKPLRGALDLMVLPIGRGLSVIQLHEGWTAIRRLSLLATLAGLVLSMAAALALRWRDQAASRWIGQQGHDRSRSGLHGSHPAPTST